MTLETLIQRLSEHILLPVVIAFAAGILFMDFAQGEAVRTAEHQARFAVARDDECAPIYLPIYPPAQQALVGEPAGAITTADDGPADWLMAGAMVRAGGRP